MAKINENFLKLQAGYLFPEIARRVRKYQQDNKDKRIISLGIGDVTQPLAPAVVDAMKKALDDMTKEKTFRGYGPEQGYDFLIKAIIENDFETRGVKIEESEVFVSDGAKCDVGNIQEIFSTANSIAVTDPVYPVYVDTNVMAGRTGNAKENGQYENILYMPCTAENDFLPDLPKTDVDIIYLCFPNNPTGTVASKQTLKQWVDFAKSQKAVIIFDAAYEAFISEPEIPHSIYEIAGAKDVAIELRSYSKTAGFTGIRCAYTVVPKQLKAYTKDGKAVDVNAVWNRRHSTKFNGVSYVSQRGAQASYSSEGKKQISEIINLYMENARLIHDKLTEFGYRVHGGTNAPYVWIKTPDDADSWGFFDLLLQKANVICTPGAGFGPSGQGYFRLSAFAKPQNVKEAIERIAEL